MNNLAHVSQSVPGIRAAVDDLASLVRSSRLKTSIRSERALAMLESPPEEGEPVAILANICGSPTPGWPITMEAESDLGSTAVELVRLRRQTRNALFARLIIPGNPLVRTSRPAVRPPVRRTNF
jgi:hypothetical protein